jgi:hypothetical protein
MATEMKTVRAKKSERKMEHHHSEMHPADNGGYTVEHYGQAPMSGARDMGYRPVEKMESNVYSTGPEAIKDMMDKHSIKAAKMIAHLKGDNAAEPSGVAEAGKVGTQADDEDEEA